MRKSVALLIPVLVAAFAISCSSTAKKKRDVQGANRDFVQALLYTARKQDDQAIAFFSKAIEKDPEFVNARINRAIFLAKRGMYVEALQDLDIETDNTTAMLVRGYVYILMGNKKKGVENVRSAAQRGNQRAAAADKEISSMAPEHIKSRITELLAIEYDNLCSDAQKAVEDIYARAIKNGNAYVSHDMNDDAVSEFSKALVVKPESSEALVGRGYAYIGKGMFDKAVSDFQRAVKANSHWREFTISDAHIGAGTAFSKKSDFTNAVLEYTMAIEKCASDDKETLALAYSNRGYAKFNMGEFVDAIADFKKVLDLTADEVRLKDTYAGLAISLYRNGETEMAKQYYQKAIVIDKRYMWKFVELQEKEGLFYTNDELAAMKEILLEMGIKKQQ